MRGMAGVIQIDGGERKCRERNLSERKLKMSREIWMEKAGENEGNVSGVTGRAAISTRSGFFHRRVHREEEGEGREYLCPAMVSVDVVKTTDS